MSITGTTSTFWSLVKVKNIEIPQIQRDYVQGRNDEKIKFARERFISDLHQALSVKTKIDLNFVYGKDVKSIFVPIDGQQRLTTLFLIHMYAFANEGKIAELKKLKDNFNYRTRITTERFFAHLIDNLANFFTEKSEMLAWIKNQAWFSTSWLKDQSVLSALVILQEIHSRFSEFKNLSDILLDVSCPITFMELSIPNIGQENDLYVKLNSRGKILTDFENFKAVLFEYINDKKLPKDFKRKMDGEWLEYVWNLCAKPKDQCDKAYMNILHWLIVDNAIKEDKKSLIEKLDSLSSRINNFNFTIYEPYLDAALNTIYDVLTFLGDIKDKNINLLIKKISVEREKTPEAKLYKERAMLFAIVTYANTIKAPWDKDKFADWYRVIGNLVKNVFIDNVSDFQKALISIANLGNSVCADTITHFAGLSNSSSISFFNTLQSEEEILKCKLMSVDPIWKAAILKAEANDYFSAEINFLFKLQNISITKLPTDNIRDAAIFTASFNAIEKIFTKDACTNGNPSNKILHRAILCFGDYSIQPNSFATFFFEGKKGYFDWRRMLRESKSFTVFEKFFTDINREMLYHPAKPIKDIVEDFIKGYANKKDLFVYYLIKVPELFAYMSENKYQEYGGKKMLYSCATLQGKIAEANTLILRYILECAGVSVSYREGSGYLSEESSKAYIEKINGKLYHLEYNGKCFCDNTANLLDSSGKEIKDILIVLNLLEKQGIITNAEKNKAIAV